jgi:hypothetical protein
MTVLLWLGVAGAVLAMAAVGLTVFGENRWAGRTAALQARLEAGRVDGRPGATPLPTRYDTRELEGLPAPVQRYFRAVLKDGQPLITAVNIDIAGRFNLSPTGEQWKPFTSRQRVVTRRPGFLWDARVFMFPGLPALVEGDGLQRRSFLYIDDAVDAFEAIRTKGQVGHAYNIAGPREASVLDVVAAVLRAIRPGESLRDWTRFVPDRSYQDRRYFISADKIRGLGWTPKVDLDEAIARIAADAQDARDSDA